MDLLLADPLPPWDQLVTPDTAGWCGMALFLKWVSLCPTIKTCSAAASSRLPSLAVAPGFASPAAWPHPAHDSGHGRCSRNGFGRLIRSLSSLHHRRPLIRDGPLLAESVTALQLTGKT